MKLLWRVRKHCNSLTALSIPKAPVKKSAKKKPSAQVLDSNGMARPKTSSGKSTTATKKPKTSKKGVWANTQRVDRYLTINPLPASAIPDGMPAERVIATLRKIVEEKMRTNGKLTEGHMIGRYWELDFLKFQFVKKNIAALLKDTLEMLDEFRKNHHRTMFGDKEMHTRFKMGFLNGDGGFTFLSASDLLLIDMAIKNLKQATLMNMRELAKSGLVYADSFKIGSTQFKDGAFIIPLEKHFIVLMNIETKTKFSDGIIAQLQSFFVRLAGAKKSEEISFNLGDTVIHASRDQFLFNPMWLDAQVGVKEANIDRLAGFAQRVTQEFSRRVKSQKERFLDTPNAERSNFYGNSDPTPGKSTASNLLRLGVRADVIYSDTNLRGLKNYIDKMLETLRKEELP